ncbi:Phosphoglycolate phosphatase [compost metagenome]
MVDDVLGRDEAPPKPQPHGLLQLASRWAVAPGELAMVGDFVHDLSCARAAGARSVLVNHPENPWPELTDLYARDCAELQRLLG